MGSMIERVECFQTARPISPFSKIASHFLQGGAPSTRLHTGRSFLLAPWSQPLNQKIDPLFLIIETASNTRISQKQNYSCILAEWFATMLYVHTCTHVQTILLYIRTITQLPYFRDQTPPSISRHPRIIAAPLDVLNKIDATLQYWP